MAVIHVARLALLKSTQDGRVFSSSNKKDFLTGQDISIKDVLHCTEDFRVLADSTIPNTASYQKIKKYIEEEADDGFILVYMDQTFVITTGEPPEPDDGADIYPSEPIYRSPFQLQASGSLLADSTGFSKDVLHLFPLSLPARMLAKQIGVGYVSGGTTPFKLKFGLYDLNDPRNLVWESPEQTVTAAGTYTDPAFIPFENPIANPLNLTIEPKSYLFAILHNSATDISLRGGSSGTTKPLLYIENIGSGSIEGNLINRLSFTQVYTSFLPASLTGLPGGSSANNTVNIPYLFFRT